jgi:hypothetical protein
MPGSFCSVDEDCPTGEVCVDGVCVSREGWLRCHGYDLQEYQNGQWVTIEPNSPTCGYTEDVLKDTYYYDLYNRGGIWVNAAAEYLSSITSSMPMVERYQIYLEIYYRYAGGAGTPTEDYLYYDLYNRGGNWLNAAAEYLSAVTTDMPMVERYQIYLEIYYRYATDGSAPPANPPQEAFPWTWLLIGGAAAIGIVLITSALLKQKRK